MGEDSKDADGALQSTIHLPKQWADPVIQGGQRAKGNAPCLVAETCIHSNFLLKIIPL